MEILNIFSGYRELKKKLSDLEERSEGKSTPVSRIDDPRLWPSLFQYLPSKTGQNVNPDTALQSSAVYACVRVLAETMASLPLMVYKRKDKGKDVADSHELYFLLHDMPNPFQTSFEFREMAMGHLCLRGNFFAFKEMTKGGDILRIWPLHPAHMQVRREKGGQVIFQYADPISGRTEIIPNDLIWHIKGLSADGILGLSPISLAREAIGQHLTQMDYAARLYSNSPHMAGVIKTPGNLKDEQQERLRKQFVTATTGDNAFLPPVMSGGLEWVNIGMNNEDAQFIESMNFSIEDIARIFRVPTVLIQHPDKTSTYASAEQFFLSFVTHTIRPWAVRWEQSANKDLLSERDRKRYFVEYNLDGLLRGDLESRYRAYSIGIQWGFLSPNDIRERENMNPRSDDGGDAYLRPLNMQPSNEAPVEPKPQGGDPNAITGSK